MGKSVARLRVPKALPRLDGADDFLSPLVDPVTLTGRPFVCEDIRQASPPDPARLVDLLKLLR